MTDSPIFSIPVRVYYEDTDAAGIVYHAAYLRFAERARSEMMRAAGVPVARLAREDGLQFVAARVDARFLRPAWLDDLLTVTAHPVEVGGARVVVEQQVRGAGGLVAHLMVTLAVVRTGGLAGSAGALAARPARLPPALIAALRPYSLAQAESDAAKADSVASGLG